MANKEIYIDGVDVSGCSFFDIHYSEDEDVEIKNFCRIVHYNCDSYPNCYYKQLKRKEQECEEFRKANDEKNEILAKLGCPTIATARRKVFCLQEQLDQLKAENDELKDLNTRLDNQRETYWKGYQKLKQTLTEIKEIAEKRNYLDYNECLDDILQKISECEGNNER